MQAAYQQVEDEEDEHLYHTTGWSRELWIASLGLPAVLPPPEEEKDGQNRDRRRPREERTEGHAEVSKTTGVIRA